MDKIVEEGIERYIKHVRKISSLTDAQIKILISQIYNQDPSSIEIIGNNIENYIKNIRQMSVYDDKQLKDILTKAVNTDNELRNTFEDAANKKLLLEIKEMAKDIKSNPVKFSRKVA